MAFVLFSAMRNEAPFLFDWIAYHKSIGFDRICIVTNDCTDGSYPLLEKLSEAGIVDHVDQVVPEGVSPQKNAVERVTSMNYLADGDWAIFLDADEYLNIKLGEGRVSNLVSYLENRSVQGMLVNWKLFGDAGQTQFEDSYIDETYIQCEAASSYTQFKTFFKVGAISSGFSPFLHRCRITPNTGKLTDFLVGSGEVLGVDGGPKALRRHNAWLLNGDDPFAHVQNGEIGYDIAQVNHYIVRDPASFKLKKARGRGYKPQSKHNGRHTDDFYNENNKNEVYDRSILRWRTALVETKRELKEQYGLVGILSDIRRTYLDAVEPTTHSHMTIDKVTGDAQFPLALPDVESELLRVAYVDAKAIIEYGTGGSTVLAAKLESACTSIDSDRARVARMNAFLHETYGEEPSAIARHVNIGATQERGYPQNRRRSDQYWRYPLQVWDDPGVRDVDTVFIAGRFRKACFAATLMNARSETRILFDDYMNREFYHDVEALLKPTRMVGRMAEFVVSPGLIAADQFSNIIPWFADVR
jgi:hypothetical protein